MKTKHFRSKLMCVLLAFSMLAVLFSACATENDDITSDGTGSDGDLASTQGPATDEKGLVLDNIPDDLKFNESVTVVVSESQKNQVAPPDDSVDVVLKAIHTRNMNVEDRLGLEITFLPLASGWNERESFCQAIKVTAGSGSAYDALCIYNPMPGALASAGLLQNIGDTEYIDLNSPWWPQSFVNEVLLDNTLFSLVESSSYGTLRNMHGVFFNNDLIKDLNLKDPYTMVAENDWTFSSMMAMIKDIGYDMNSNGVKDKDDFFGIVTGTQAKIESWFFGMGYKYCTKTESGTLELTMSDVYYMVEWIDEFTSAAASNDFLLYEQNGHTRTFFDKKSVLYMSSLQLVENGVRNGIEMDYGVVPLPKKDSNQARYLTNIANSHDSWCVPINVKDIDMSSALIECMASESYREVAPVYFEQCIKLRYSPDEKLASMYDLIREGIVFDFTSIFSFSFATDPRTLLHETVKNPQNKPWPSQWETNGVMFETGFSEILNLYQNAAQ